MLGFIRDVVGLSGLEDISFHRTKDRIYGSTLIAEGRDTEYLIIDVWKNRGRHWIKAKRIEDDVTVE